MSGRVGPKKLLIQVNGANIRNNHLYLNGIGDFFPRDCLGSSSKRTGLGTPLRLDVAGIPQPVRTDIPTDPKTGRPRSFFRERSWVGSFFRYHGIRDGDLVAVERKGDHHYSVKPEYPSREFTVAEFFAGIGLVRVALERQGWRVVFANDICRDKAEMYLHNWPTAEHLLVADVHSLSAEAVPPCQLVTASFPCNDLSIAGRWAGLDGEQSSAFWGLIRILKDMGKRRPPLVMLENVLGFLQSNGGKDFESALLALNGLGYAVDAFILNAVHWVPQSRVRLFVVAKSVDAGGTRNPFAMESDTRPESLFVFINTHPNIRWDIRDLPRLPKPRLTLEDIVEDLPDNDPHWWNRKRSEYFFNQLSERHLLAAKRMMGQRKYSFATAFRRVRYGRSMAELRTDGVAGCLRTPRGGSGRQILFKAGKGKYRVRLLTARECARLQGVPDSYAIDVPLNKALFGFGDAVCVPAVKWIAEHYLTPVASALVVQTNYSKERSNVANRRCNSNC